MSVDPKGRPPEEPSDDEAGMEDELLETGQEEVFSRTEVETGKIEHATGASHKPRPS